MRNQYKGKCFRCGKEVPAGAGFFQRAKIVNGGGTWLVRCISCVGKGNNIEQKKP